MQEDAMTTATTLDLEIVWEAVRPGAVVPQYVHDGDAGADLVCCEGVTLEPWECRDVAIGLRAELPAGFYARITGRSSTIRRRGMEVHEGIIDTLYRGEWYVLVTNRNGEPATIVAGDRLGQIILAPVHQARMRVGAVSTDTSRGVGGFGSTGLSS